MPVAAAQPSHAPAPALPGTYRCWELSGAGLEHLALVRRDLRPPAAGELLVRIDACGICFSDIKILRLGPDHPRLQGRDLNAEPVVMGHETAMTVAAVGSGLEGRFHPGQRFLIQADVYAGGVGMAFGYRLPGGYGEYQYIGPHVLEGDEGCYLLPVGAHVSHAQAALAEPWACVEAAYAYRPRRGPLPGGRALIVLVDFEEVRDLADELTGLGEITVLTPVEAPWLREAGGTAAGVARLQERHPDGFDDILVYGMPDGELAGALATLLRPDGVFGIQGRGSSTPARIDLGSIHYRNHWYTGQPEGDVYRWHREAELQPGGVAWFIGAGGPLGQMHLQRALSLPRPPARIIVSQNGGPRFDDLRERFSAAARQRGVHLALLDPRALGDAHLEAVRAECGSHGCDDIVVIIPNPAVVEQAYPLLAPGGGMNIFAGVAVGVTASLEIGRVASEGVRLWGTSGSTIADLRRIAALVEDGTLATDRVVAAVGGLEAVRAGLEAVRDGTFLGKTVIYPHLPNLPLLSVPELAERHPSLRALLEGGRYWTPAAEAELFRLYGAAQA